MARSLVYKLIMDASGVTSGARKAAHEAQALSKSLSGVKTSTLDVKEAQLKLERATAHQTRVMDKQKDNLLAVRAANLRVERAQLNLTEAQQKLTRAQSTAEHQQEELTQAQRRGLGTTSALSGKVKTLIGTGASFAGFYGLTQAIRSTGEATVGFDKAMRNVNSIAQLPEKNLATLQKRVLGLAGKTAQAPQTLAEGLYDIVSSGFEANDAMKILGASAKAATAGLTTTEVSTKAVTAVLNAYHKPASAAAQVSDQLFQTVNLGVINFEQLASTIGDVLPFASSLGVGLDQLGASISTMTKAGIGPEETMTRLKNVMVAFLKPSEGMSKAFKQLGVDSGEALIQQKGFQGALEAVVGTTDGTKAAVATLFPNIRSLGGALALTGKNAKGAEADLRKFGDTSGATDKALSQQSKSFDYQWKKFSATLDVLKIKLGAAILPTMVKLAQTMTGFVQGMLDGTGAGGRFRDTLEKIWKAAQPTVKFIAQAVVSVGKFVGHHPALVKVAASIAAIGLALKTLKFASAISGISTFASAAATIGTRAGGAFKRNFGSSVKMSEGEASTAVRPLSRVLGVAMGALLAVELGKSLSDAFKNKNVIDAGDIKLNLPKKFQWDPFGLGNHWWSKGLISFGIETLDMAFHRSEIPLKNFGETAQKALKVFQESGSAKGMDDLGNKAREMADKFPKYRNQLMLLARTLDQDVAGAFQQTVGTVRDSFKGMNRQSLKKLRDNVEANMGLIENTLGDKSKKGKDALRENFRLAIRAVQRRMDEGTLSVQTGMQEISWYLGQELSLLNITPGGWKGLGAGIRDSISTILRSAKPPRRKTKGSATGGWIGMRGQAGQDTVPAMLGVGEAVLNRHQQVPVENALHATYGIGLDQLFQQVRTPHYLAKGGKIPNRQMRRGLGVLTVIGQGALDKADHHAEEYLRRLAAQAGIPAGVPGSLKGAGALARELGLTITSTTGGKHVANSWHYRGRAMDVAGSGSAMARFFRAAYRRYGSNLLELFYDPMGYYVKNGARVSGAIGGHSDHVHIALTRGGRARFAGGGWVKTGATRYDDPPPGAGNLGRPGYHFAELGTATSSGRGTGRGYLARLFGMSGELAMGTKLQVRRGGKTITADKQDRGYGQGSSAYAIDLWRGAADALGVSKGPVEVRLLRGGKSQATISELNKKHSALDKKWRAEMRQSSPRSQELLKIANAGLKLTEDQKSRRGKALRKLWKDRHAYAVKRRSKRRALNVRRDTADRRQRNSETVAGILEGNLLAAQLSTPDDLTDDAQVAANALKFWRAKQAEDLEAWQSGRVTDPSELQRDQSEIQSWQERYDTATGKNNPDVANTAQLLQSINDELVAMRKRAEFIGNTSEGALARAVTAVVSGQIGGQVGLGFASPSYTGSYARY